MSLYIILVQIIFSGPLISLDFDNRVLLLPVLGGVTSIVHFITDHEQTHLKRV